MIKRRIRKISPELRFMKTAIGIVLFLLLGIFLAQNSQNTAVPTMSDPSPLYPPPGFRGPERPPSVEGPLGPPPGY